MSRFCAFILVVFSCLAINAQELNKDRSSGLQYVIKQGSPSGNCVVLLHGYGSNEKDLFSFANYFPEGTTFICPKGPITYSNTSFSWYDIEFKQDGNHQRNLKQALESSDKIILFLKSMKTQYQLTNKIILGGFSQGAIMSLYLAINEPKLIDGLIGLSGMLLTEDLVPNSECSQEYAKLVAFYGHGTNDQVLPILHGRKYKTILENANIKTTYKEYPIAHTISQPEIQDLLLWYKHNFNE